MLNERNVFLCAMHAAKFAVTFDYTMCVHTLNEGIFNIMSIKCAQTLCQIYAIDMQNFYQNLLFKKFLYYFCNCVFDSTLISSRKKENQILFCLTSKEVTQNACPFHKKSSGICTCYFLLAIFLLYFQNFSLYYFG